MTKKVETSIHKANGGNHSPVNYRKHKAMLSSHPYKNGYLYHLVLTGSEDRKVYRKAVELLCKQLRSKGMPCRYKACYERDKFKRFHKHVFLLIEAKDVHPDTVIHFRKGHWFKEMTESLGLQFKIAKPQDPMHYVAGKQVNYAYVPKKAGAKLDDCLLWISYLTKVRSKAGVDGQIYTGSTNREAKKPVPPIAALPAAKEESIPLDSGKVVLPEVGENLAEPTKGDELTPADKYIAGKYEKAIGQKLDVEAIRLYLLSHGIKRTPGQVTFDLDEQYGFYGYAASHPAPRRLTYAEIDVQLEHPSRIDRVSPFRPIGRPMGRGQTNTNRQGTT